MDKTTFKNEIKKTEPLTAPTQKAGFRVPKTHLCKPKVQYSE